ncbi:MAG TPA: serine hydrolase domain-containing protein [Chthoniobacteraceae bacterium]|jgi:CubicO group peptidase (beta-lactamase class C family)|nr:serine hydrolase domain-containing protein [Chthoniobacteraceae bacterium]
MLLPLRFVVALAGCALFSLPLAAEEKSGPLRAAVQPLVESNSLAGAVMLVANGEKVLDVETAGFADREARTPMPADALFWIASMSKAMTAASVMMLVDEGKVKLDDAVEKYLPEFKGQMVIAEQDAQHVLLKPPGHPITVREVLSHTSGLPFKSPFEFPTLDLLPLASAVRGYAGQPLVFEPGTKYQYSNEGINTAGRIVEAVGGMKFEEFLDRRLFGPLGMTDTTFWPTKEQQARLAKSYKGKADKSDLEVTGVGQLVLPLDDRHRGPMPAGGLFSTAQDVARFCQMLLNQGTLGGKRVLSEAAVKEMSSKQTGDQVKDNYGFGLSVGADGSYGHGGAYATDMKIDPAHGLVFVYLVQHAGWRDDLGKTGPGVFRKAALEAFGAK